MWMPPLYRDFTTPAQIDAQYGTQQWVPDPAAEARHYVERSRAARARLRCLLDQPYGPTLDETLDIFPADRRGAPCVVIQGGDEIAKGEVQIKDLIAGAKASETIKDAKEWREGRPAQFSVPEDELVEPVKRALASQAG